MIKRVVLSKFWVGETVYHTIYKENGLITRVAFSTDRLVPQYFIVFAETADGWCDEMELTAETVSV